MAVIYSLTTLKVSAGLGSSLDSGRSTSWTLGVSDGHHQSSPSSARRATIALSATVVSWPPSVCDQLLIIL